MAIRPHLPRLPVPVPAPLTLAARLGLVQVAMLLGTCYSEGGYRARLGLVQVAMLLGTLPQAQPCLVTGRVGRAGTGRTGRVGSQAV